MYEKTYCLLSSSKIFLGDHYFIFHNFVLSIISKNKEYFHEMNFQSVFEIWDSLFANKIKSKEPSLQGQQRLCCTRRRCLDNCAQLSWVRGVAQQELWNGWDSSSPGQQTLVSEWWTWTPKLSSHSSSGIIA